MERFLVSELQLQEMFELVLNGYHVAYHEDNGDYLTICLTDDNGNMKDEEITDRFFDLEKAVE